MKALERFYSEHLKDIPDGSELVGDDEFIYSDIDAIDSFIAGLAHSLVHGIAVSATDINHIRSIKLDGDWLITGPDAGSKIFLRHPALVSFARLVVQFAVLTVEAYDDANTANGHSGQ